MAKMSKTVTFKNAMIDLEHDCIIETTKDDTMTYGLKDILEDWDGVTGVSINLKKEDEIPTEDDE